jgi:hypothetical protein
MTSRMPWGTRAADADRTAEPMAATLPSRRVTAVMLLAAAALDLTRCGLAVATIRPAGEVAVLVSAGLAAAGISLWTARGCQRGARWSGCAAFLIGAASAPQAAASGFNAAYTVPDAATAALGVLVAVGVLATAGHGGRPRPPGSYLPASQRTPGCRPRAKRTEHELRPPARSAP